MWAVAATAAGGAIAAAAVLLSDSAGPVSSTVPAAPAVAGIDYNCNLPGKGFPWLVHYDRRVAPQGRAGVFASTVGPRWDVGLPVDLSTGEVNYNQVYDMLCLVHPDLGGTEARHLTADEIEQLQAIWQMDPFPPAEWWARHYTDGKPPEPGEALPAAYGTEGLRIYYLPPIPRDLLDALVKPADKDSTTTSTRPEETQRWRVSLTGYEISDLDPYLATGKYAVRFNYTLEADFTLVNRDNGWAFGTSTMTSSSIRASDLYDHQQWEVQPLQCGDCDDYAKNGKLFVDVNEAGVRFSWGVNPIRVTVRYRKPCVGAGCTEWLSHYHDSATFLGRVSGHRIPLKDFQETWTYTSSAGDRWVAYTYKLTRRQ